MNAATVIDDGGPVYPTSFEPLDTADYEARKGMSLRDWLAGQALVGLMVNYNEHPHTVSACAEIAYNAADAMLAARKGGQP